MTDEQFDQLQRDVKLYGVAYRYRGTDSGEDQLLDPTRVVTYRTGINKRPVTQVGYGPRRNARLRRLARHMTEPMRLLWGLPVAFVVAAIDDSHHHITNAGVAAAYGSWLIAVFLIFWLYEIHHWAGGRSKLNV